MSKPWLYTGRVVHERFGSLARRFSYPALFILFPLAQKQALNTSGVGLNRWRLMSWHEADHGLSGDVGETWARKVFQQAGIPDNAQLYLQTQPRILGFVFNPVSFWMALSEQHELLAVIAEVNNTFGERHAYVIKHPNGQHIRAHDVIRRDKSFHVSPFMPLAGEYHFSFEHRADRFIAKINYWADDQLTLKTVITGRPQELTARNITRTVIQYGWSTVMVVLRIHWQALLLVARKAPFYKKPPAPRNEITS